MRSSRLVPRIARSFLCVLALAAACGPPPDQAPPDIGPAKAEALTHAQVAAAQQAGLLAGGAQPEWIDPVSPSGLTLPDVTPAALNNNGTVVGYSSDPNVYSWGNRPIAYPFIKDSNGERYTPGPWSDGSAYVGAIGDDGTIVGWGGPASSEVADPVGMTRPFLFHPDGSSEVLPVPGTRFTGMVTDSYGTNLMTGTGSVYGGPQVGNGTMAHWQFDGNGTDSVAYDVLDDSMPTIPADFQPDGGPEGGPYLSMDGNRCLQIPVQNSYQQVSTGSEPGVTMMAWVRLQSQTQTCSASFRPLVMNTWESVLAIGCRPDGTAGVVGEFFELSNPGFTSPDGNIPFNAWTHVAVTWDHHTIRTYINGAQVGSHIQEGSFTPYGSWVSVGCWPQDLAFNFAGDLSDVAVLRNPLGPDQVLQYAHHNTAYRVGFGYQWARYRTNSFDGRPEYSLIPVMLEPNLWWGGEPMGVASDGTMVGYQYFVSEATTAAIYQPEVDGGMKDLNTIPDPNGFLPSDNGWNLTFGTAINNARTVVGIGTFGGSSAAFSMSLTDGKLVNLGHLEGNWSPTYGTLVPDPMSINSSGHVVGTEYTVYWQPQTAFIYTPESGMTDLNELLDPALRAAGWLLQTATKINDNDEIIGMAVSPTGLQKGYKLKVPAAVSLSASSPSVTPLIECTHDIGNGTSRAVFGYASAEKLNAQIAPNSISNDLTGASAGATPPTWFFPGTNLGAFVVTYPTGGTVSWKLNGTTVSTAGGGGQPPPPACVVSTGTDGLFANIGLHISGIPDFTVLIDPGSTYPFQDSVMLTETTYTPDDIAYDQALTAAAAPFPVELIGPRAAGAIPAQFSVTDDGAAQYEIPIVTPPGRAGVEPHLRLVYNSRAGDGALGVGWTLAGLSKIARCTRTRADAAQMSAALNATIESQPIRFDSTDELCMDGERLVRVNSTGHAEFRTQRDVFAKIVVLDEDAQGPLAFDVFRQDGRIETYGALPGTPATSRIDTTQTIVNPDGAGNPVTTTRPVRAAWYVSKVADRYHNALTITYVNSFPTPFPIMNSSNTETEALPDEIRYTANDATGRQADRSVKFTYVNYRGDDHVPVATAGWVRGRAKIISTIDIKGPAPRNEGLVRQYRFTYATPLGTNTLIRMQVCDGSGACQSPTNLVYETQNLSFAPVDTTVSDAYLAQSALANASTAFVNFQNSSRSMQAGDVNGDGLDDLVYRRNIPSQAGAIGDPDHDPSYLVRLSTGSNFGDAHPTGFPVISPTEYEQTFLPVAGLADLNGDGRLDVVLPHQGAGEAGQPQDLELFLSSGSATSMFDYITTAIDEPICGNLVVDPEFCGPTAIRDFRVGDFTGDGLPELVRGMASSQLPRVAYRPSAVGGWLGAYQYITIQNPGPRQLHPVWPALQFVGPTVLDLDGDGRAELLYVDSFQASFDSHYSVAHVDAAATTVGYSALPISDALGPTFIDYNGDGLKDAITWTSATARLWLNTGNGFVGGGVIDARMPGGQVADFDGDGKEDVLSQGCTIPSAVFLSDGTGSFAEHQILDVPPGASVPKPGNGLPRCLPVTVLDINGDGLPDILQAEEGRPNLQLYINQGKPVNRLKTIRNGVGSTIAIEYSMVAASATECQFPEQCGRKVQAVSAYEVDNGTNVPNATRNRFTLSYQHPVTDTLGRGWQGFAVRTERNEQTLETNTKTFDLTRVGTFYPHAGVPVTDTTDIPLTSTGGFIRKKRSVSDFQKVVGDPSLGVPFAVRPSVIVEQEWDTYFDATSGAPPPPLTSRTTTLGYDSFGNTTSKHVESNNAFRSFAAVDDTQTIYDQNSSAWLISLPRSVTQHSTGPNTEVGPPRFTTFDEDPCPAGVVPGDCTGAVRFTHVEPTDGTDDERLTVETVINNEGNLTQTNETDATGQIRTQSISYDDLDGTFPATITNALGHVTRLSYHQGLGVLASRVDPDGATTTLRYDGLGRFREQQTSTTPMTAVSYQRTSNDVGSFITWTSAAGGSGSTTYDSLGRDLVVSSIGADGQTRTQGKSYDRNSGALASATRPSQTGLGGATSILYDEARRPIQVSSPGEDPKFIRYQDLAKTTFQGPTLATAIGRTVEMRDEAGRTTESVNIIGQSHIATGRGLTTVRSTTTDFDYGPFNLLRHVYNQGTFDPKITTEMQYDRLGRRKTLIDPDSGTTSTTYNAFGDVRRETDNSGVDTIIVPDALGRSTSITKDGATDVFSWDTAPGAGGLGQLGFSISASAVVAVNSYDGTGHLVNQASVIDDRLYSVAVQYEPNTHKVTGISYPDVTSDGRIGLSYEYSQIDGSPSKLFMTHSTSPVWQMSGLSDGGAVALETFGNGEVAVHDYDDVSGRLMHIAAGTGMFGNSASGYQEPAQTAHRLTYSYDSFGRVFTKTNWKNSSDPEIYGYDNIDRLTSWTTGGGSHSVTYDYSDLGNLKARHETTSGTLADESYTYGAGAGPHALTGGPLGSSYQYDLNGRQKSRPGQPLLSYNRFDLPEEIQHDGTSTFFKYDAFGTRAEKVMDQTATAYVGGLYERRAAGGTVSHVFYVPGPNGPIAQLLCTGEDGAATCGTWTYLHADGIGSVDTTTNDGTGVNRISRDPYGRGSSGGDVHLGFTGEEQDDDLGLVNLNHRLYDAKIGRFVSPDSLVSQPMSAQGHNRYAYVLNSPTMATDRSGLSMDSTSPKDEHDVTTVLDPIIVLDRTSNGGDNGTTFTEVTIEGPASDPLGLHADQMSPTDIDTSGGVDPASAPFPSANDFSDQPRWATDGPTNADVPGPNPIWGDGPAKVLGDPNFRIVDTSATWRIFGEIGLVLVNGPEGIAEVGAESAGIQVTEKGLSIVEQHLARDIFEQVSHNAAMIERLRDALSSGLRLQGADAAFYLHEVNEATMMARGLSYGVAHAAALAKYGVTEMHLYHPSVVGAFPEAFNNAWRAFWNLP